MHHENGDNYVIVDSKDYDMLNKTPPDLWCLSDRYGHSNSITTVSCHFYPKNINYTVAKRVEPASNPFNLLL
jgi:hypothetical protein